MSLKALRTPIDIVEKYTELKENINSLKIRQESKRTRNENIEDTHRNLKTDISTVVRFKDSKKLNKYT